MRATPARIAGFTALFLALLAVVLAVCLATGSSTGIEFWQVIAGIVSLKLFTGAGWCESSRLILLDLRLPRLLLAALAGGSLATAGIVFQALLRNPLAEPYILGVSSGSAVGAIAAILFGLGGAAFGIPTFAFLGGLATIATVFSLAGSNRRLKSDTLLLTGVIVSAFFSAIIMFLVSITRDERVHNMLFWLMGDLSSARWGDLAIVSPVIALVFAILYYHGRFLNLIVTGEEAALQMGVDVERLKWLLLVAASLLTGVLVSFTGIIGFVGLVVPHMVRLLLGSDHRLLLPASFLFGGTFLAACDTLARCVNPSTELPVGVITAMCGAPFFIYLLRRRER